MSDKSIAVPAAQGGWKPWGAAVFAAVWGSVGALLMEPPARGFLEDAAGYTGKLIGFGMAPGLVAAVVAHLLILRGQSGKAKGLAYLAGALAGGLVALIAHG